MEAKKPKEEPRTVTLEEALLAAIPEPIAEKVRKQQEDHESNFRLHPDKVAVLDISTSVLSEIDGIPGQYDVLTEPVEHTKQGLWIYDRYEVRINMVPTTDRKYEFTIVDVKEWQKHAKDGGSAGLTTEQEIASQMLRQGDA